MFYLYSKLNNLNIFDSSVIFLHSFKNTLKLFLSETVVILLVFNYPKLSKYVFLIESLECYILPFLSKFLLADYQDVVYNKVYDYRDSVVLIFNYIILPLGEKR